VQNTIQHKQNGNGVEHNGAGVNGNGNGPLPVHIFNINPEGGVTEKEWTIIATKKVKGNWCTSVYRNFCTIRHTFI
jgi:hypothetical protein